MSGPGASHENGSRGFVVQQSGLRAGFGPGLQRSVRAAQLPGRIVVHRVPVCSGWASRIPSDPRGFVGLGFLHGRTQSVQAGKRRRFPVCKESCEMRFIRGGSWNFNPVNARASNQGFSVPSERYLTIGFRCVRGGRDVESACRKLRGGSFSSIPSYARVSFRGDPVSARRSNLGFRCVRRAKCLDT